MKAVKADIASSKPISLSKASAILSHFTTSDTGAQPDVCAYLRRAAAAFEELVAVHREIRHHCKISQVEQKDDGRHQKKGKETGDCEADTRRGNSLFSGVVEKKKVNGKEEEESGRVRDATESNGAVENKKVGKRDRKDELSEDEMKSAKVESRKPVETKKRQHSDAENGRMAGQMMQNEGKKRRR